MQRPIKLKIIIIGPILRVKEQTKKPYEPNILRYVKIIIIYKIKTNNIKVRININTKKELHITNRHIIRLNIET